MKEFGWAVIGTGKIAEKVIGEAIKAGCGKVVAVWNRTKERAQEFTKKFGGCAFDTPEEAVLAKGVEGVYIATTHDKHGYFTKLCINLGVPVLCEKPFAVNLKEAEEVFNLARAKGVYASEAMWTWHNKTAHTVRDWILKGEIGKVKSFKASFAAPMLAFTHNPRLTSPQLIGGALLDIGIYPVRYAYELFGLPQKITCTGKVKGGVDIGESITFDYGDFKAEMFSSMASLRGEGLTIVGEKGKISVPLFHKAHSARLVKKQGKGETFYDKSYLYATQLLNVANEIRSGKKQSDFCPMQATLDTMAILDECRKQLGVKYPCE